MKWITRTGKPCSQQTAMIQKKSGTLEVFKDPTSEMCTYFVTARKCYMHRISQFKVKLSNHMRDNFSLVSMEVNLLDCLQKAFLKTYLKPL